MSNTRIRKHAFATVYQNKWKIILLAILMSIITGVISSLLAPNLNIEQMTQFQQQLEQGHNEALLHSWGGMGSVFWSRFLSALILPLLTVGTSFWMPLKLADTGKYDINEWFASYQRNTRASFLTVIFFTLLSQVLSLIFFLLYFVLIFFMSGLIFIPQLVSIVEEGLEPSWGFIGLFSLFVILSLVVMFLFSLFITIYFSLPYFIVYDFKTISLNDLWRLNLTLLKGKLSQALKLNIWFYIIYLLAAIGAGLLIGLFFFVISLLSQSSGFVLAILVGLCCLLFFFFFLACSALFFTAQKTAWASFYRESMKEKIDELEYQFPHIQFRPLVSLGIQEKSYLEKE